MNKTAATERELGSAFVATKYISHNGPLREERFCLSCKKKLPMFTETLRVSKRRFCDSNCWKKEESKKLEKKKAWRGVRRKHQL